MKLRSLNSGLIRPLIRLRPLPGPTVPGDGFPSSRSVRGKQSGEHPGHGEGGGGSLEGPAGRLRRPQGAAGGHGREVPLLHHGARADGLDGEHHPADRDSGETQVSRLRTGIFSLIRTFNVNGKVQGDTFLFLQRDPDNRKNKPETSLPPECFCLHEF